MLPGVVVNVASIPQRSPFRYPGGKTWLVPQVRAWLGSLARRPRRLIEPFAGGGIVGLTAAFEALADSVVLVELDEDVAAVWQTLLNGDAQWLAERIVRFELTAESARRELARRRTSTRQRAFRTLLKNRVHHGGIMARGSRMIRRGEAGKGVASRWYPETLKRRILCIDAIREKIEFVEADGMKMIQQRAGDADCAFFIDPPYTASGKKAGRRLYAHFELDHARLFELAAALRGDFLMTYDNSPGVLELARRHGFDCEPVAMKNAHHAELTELLIGRNLDWARRARAQRGQLPLGAALA